jgi:hypothetical protein
MPINRFFLSYMAAVGFACGAILVIAPDARNLRVPPYFWVLALMIAFELTAYLYGRGRPGTVIGMDVRLFGFVMAIVLMIVLPIFAGSPGRLF